MLQTSIRKISREFIEEALSSPRLLEDMAAMEKYMSESYGERILIELLQNADDALSTRVKVLNFDDKLIFANDGQPFNENDITAISRSGSSTKKRGSMIGYRGVGFKSVANITDDIVIFSNNVYFSFSKKNSAKVLQVELNKIPTIRIPFLLNETEISDDIIKIVQELSLEGYSTIFVFNNIKVNKVIEEIRGFNNGYLIFLKKIKFLKLKVREVEKEFTIKRKERDIYRLVQINSEKNEEWIIATSRDKKITNIAFKVENNKIVSCDHEEAVYHCYLPTLDRTGYPFKINSDFSTDPSRKHLSKDTTTDEAIRASARLLFDIITKQINTSEVQMFKDIFSLLLNSNSFSKFAIYFSEIFRKLVKNEEWLTLNKGNKILIEEYKVFPNWIEESEIKLLRTGSSYIRDRSLSSEVYNAYDNIEKFIKNFSNRKYGLEDFIEILSDKNLVEQINNITLGKLWANVIKLIRTESIISSKTYTIDECYIVNNHEVVQLISLKGKYEISLPLEIKNQFSQVLSNSDLQWFDSQYGYMFGRDGELNPNIKCSTNPYLDFNKPLEMKRNVNNIPHMHTDLITVPKKVTLSKWRSAEQKCVELERNFGNIASDVSKQNLGYDIFSRSEDGVVRYIEVKSISKIGDQFTMTNNEYTSAYQHGENYFLCLITEDNTKIEFLYIKNPLQNLILEKRVRQWEWLCEEYSGEKITIDL